MATKIPERLRHALISFDKSGERHYNYVKYRPTFMTSVADHIAMYCFAKKIKSPVFMAENSMGKKLWTKVL